jgi:hypothetical protein
MKRSKPVFNQQLLRYLVVPLFSVSVLAACSSGNDNNISDVNVPGSNVLSDDNDNTAPTMEADENTVQDTDNTALNSTDTESQNDSPASDISTDSESPDTDADTGTAGNDAADSGEAADNETAVESINALVACQSTDSDTDGDGYGYESGRSCLIVTENSSDAGTPTSDANAPVYADQFPVCLLDDSDSDGDGYGYEDSNSCIVVTDTDNDTLDPSSDMSGDGVTSFPLCESSLTDPDGDGYGYENDMSCLVASDADASLPDAVVEGPATLPTCALADSDPDGDGFGYENEQSCLVAATEGTAEETEDTEDTGDGLSDSDQSLTDEAATGSDNVSDSTLSHPFYEDFSQPILTVSEQLQLSDDATGTMEYLDGYAVGTITSNSDQKERIRLRPRVKDVESIHAVISIEPESIAATEDSRVEARVSATLFNDTSATPPADSTDCYPGDTNVTVTNRLKANGEYVFVLNAWRHRQTDCDGGEDALILNGRGYIELESPVPQPGISHRMEIAIDRENRELSLSIDEQTFNYELSGSVYPPLNQYKTIEARVDRGPGTAVVRFDEIGVNGRTIDFTDPDLAYRYTFWDIEKTGREVDFIDGELRLESNSAGEPRMNRLAVTGNDNRYISAQMRLSGESEVATGGEVRARVGGTLFYAAETPGTDGTLNQVFASTELVPTESGTTRAQYCAWQSLNSNWSETVSLTNSDSETGCLPFTTTPVINQNYQMSTWLDEENRRIVFSIDDEVHTFDIDGPMTFDDGLYPMRLAARAEGENTRAVVFADNLESAPGAAQ